MPNNIPMSEDEARITSTDETDARSRYTIIHEVTIIDHPRNKPEEEGSPYVEELLRTRITPKTNGVHHFINSIIELYTSLSASSSFSGNRIKDATPIRDSGKPNLLLRKDGPILWRLSPMASKTREDQREASSTTMDPGCKRDSCVFLGAQGSHHLITRLDSYTGHRWLAAHKQLGG